MAVGDPGQRIEMLVDQQDRLPFLLQAAEASPDFGADQRREAFGRLIENEQLRICLLYTSDAADE